MSSVAVNCRSVAQKWSNINTMPSDVIYTITQSDHTTLVVEDNERAAKAADGSGLAKEPNTIHVNGSSVSRSLAHHHYQPHHLNNLSHQTRRFTPPRVPHPPPLPPSLNGLTSGDDVDASAGVVKTKLRSFQESRKEYYHDPTFLQSEVYRSRHLGSSKEPMEKDDEGEDHRDDHILPRHPDIKEGSMFVHLPQSKKNLQTQAELQAAVAEPLVNPESEKPREPPMETKPINNNKLPEETVESSCVVDCLYCCLQCSDCSIM